LVLSDMLANVLRIGCVSVATRRFIEVQLHRGS
jgi:hypothetical protein